MMHSAPRTRSSLALLVLAGLAACGGSVSLGAVGGETPDGGGGSDAGGLAEATTADTYVPPADAPPEADAPADSAPLPPAACARALHGTDGMYLRQVAVDHENNSLLIGSFAGTLDAGGTPLVSAGSWDAFVAKFGPRCEPIWSKRFGDADAQYGGAVTADVAGNVFLSLSGSGAIDFGAGPLPSVPAADLFLAKFDKDGNLGFAKHFGDAVNTFHIDVGYWLAADPASDSIVLSGDFADDIDFGGGVLHGRTNGTSMFVAKLGTDGHHIWSKSFGVQSDGGPAESVYGYAAAFTAGGDVLVTGASYGAFDLGGPPLIGSLFVGALAGESGAHKWSRGFANASGAAITTLTNGDVIVSGDVNGTTDFGTGAITSQGDDAFVLALAPDGATRWAKVIGDSANQVGNAVIPLPSGDALVAGHMAGSMDFGAGPLTSAGANDVFLARYLPDGGLVHASLIGDQADQTYPFLAPTGSDLVVIGGRFQGTLDAGGTILTNPGTTNDVFLIQQAP